MAGNVGTWHHVAAVPRPPPLPPTCLWRLRRHPVGTQHTRTALKPSLAPRLPMVVALQAFYGSVFSRTTAATGMVNPGIFSDVTLRTHHKQPSVYTVKAGWR